jgi:hypothetical protein
MQIYLDSLKFEKALKMVDQIIIAARLSKDSQIISFLLKQQY